MNPKLSFLLRVTLLPLALLSYLVTLLGLGIQKLAVLVGRFFYVMGGSVVDLGHFIDRACWALDKRMPGRPLGRS